MVTAEINTCSSRSVFIHETTAACGLFLRSSETTLVSSKYRIIVIRLFKFNGRTSFHFLRFGTIFSKRGPSPLSSSLMPGRFVLCKAPLLDRDQDCFFDSPAGHYLGPFFECGVQELAESGFCVLQLPGGHGFT